MDVLYAIAMIIVGFGAGWLAGALLGYRSVLKAEGKQHED